METLKSPGGHTSLIFEGHVTEFAPHTAIKLIVSGELTFDERVVHHREDHVPANPRSQPLNRSQGLGHGHQVKPDLP